MSDMTPPRKTVRFALDDDEAPTPKKTVRFALENDVIEKPSTPRLDVVEESSAPSLNGAEPSTPRLDIITDPSLAAPTLSNASQTSSSTNTHSTSSTLSPTEIRTWSEEVSSCVPREETAIAPPALHRSYSDDGGEKDATGRVVGASNEPCENCGGKVVWATRGEWLMICGECQEPQ